MKTMSKTVKLNISTFIIILFCFISLEKEESEGRSRHKLAALLKSFGLPTLQCLLLKS